MFDVVSQDLTWLAVLEICVEAAPTSLLRVIFSMYAASSCSHPRVYVCCTTVPARMLHGSYPVLVFVGAAKTCVFSVHSLKQVHRYSAPEL